MPWSQSLVFYFIIVLVQWPNNVLSAIVDIKDFECVNGLPIDIYSYSFGCKNENGTQCHFGDYAYFYGQFMYENLTSETAYMSGNMTVAGFHQPLFDHQEIDLCGNFSSDWGGACPEDNGLYDVTLSFQLPSTQHIMDWFLTGFHAKSKITIYDDAYSTNLIGECYAMVSSKTESYIATQYLGERLKSPSAFHSLIALWLFMLLSIIFCCVRRLSNYNKDSDDDSNSKKVPLIEPVYDDIEKMRSHDDSFKNWQTLDKTTESDENSDMVVVDKEKQTESG